jgi:hypothetical protein
VLRQPDIPRGHIPRERTHPLLLPLRSRISPVLISRQVAEWTRAPESRLSARPRRQPPVRLSPLREPLSRKFRPGKVFLEDYARFYRRRQQGELQWEFHADQREIGEPLRVAHLFAQLKNGPPAAQPYVSSKEVENARQLLADIPFSEMRSFLDFALSEARKTDFDVQTLGGVRQYVERYRAAREERAAAAVREAGEQQRKAEEEERAAYYSYRRAHAKVIFAGLPREEQTAIEAAAGLKTGSFNGSLGQAMRTRAIYVLTVERHGDQIKSFEEWRSQR